MSLFAKIMVVVNLILAVCFLAAAGTFLNATESWKGKHGALKTSTDSQIQALNDQVDASRKKAEQAVSERDSARGEMLAAQTQLKTLQDSNETLNARNAALQASLATLTSTQQDLQTKNSELQGLIANLRDQLSTSESEARAARDDLQSAQATIARLETEVKDATAALGDQEAANQALAQRADALATAVAMYESTHGPLPEATPMMKAVSGVVQAVDNEQDIYILSVGSNDGVKVGYEFTVYRGDQYIATIVVDKVFDNHASARTKDDLKRRAAKPGDSVSTHL